MVSRRTLFVITMMMAVLFFLFMFSGVMKDTLNDYETNPYADKAQFDSGSQWKAGKDDETDIVLIGARKEGGLYNIVSQFSQYTKRKLTVYYNIGDFKLSKENPPEIILLDSAGINFDKDISVIDSWVKAGMNIVFCNLPASSVIEGNSQLCSILGIQEVYHEKPEVLGVELFGGFLLGGDTFYRAEKDEEKELQDFDLDIPWYRTTSGTKTYIVGLMDKEKIDNEYMPGILWRNSMGEAKIFAVNGDYMSTISGIGLLSGIVSECSDYYVYPVVNAQNLTMANFPGLADENRDKMMEIYTRSQTAVFKDIVWPNLLATVEKNRNKLTCLMSMQYDYSDENEPMDTELVYYLKLIREQNSEAGLSAARKGSISVRDKMARDRQFFKENANQYRFSAFYAGKEDIDDVSELEGTINGENMKTITTDFDDAGTVLSYVGKNVTLQMGTIDGFNHTYQQDMRVKGLETALGYSNILTDMNRVSWPEDGDIHYEKLSDNFSKFTNTYWQSFKDFEQTTLSESDSRVRNFLALDYADSREDNKIHIDVENAKGKVWFILRTHGEMIDKITGGNFTELEKDVFLIETDKSEIDVELKETHNDNYFYMGGESRENDDNEE